MLMITNSSEIAVTVKLFAAYQEAYGVPEIILYFSSSVPVKDILNQILLDHPELAQWQSVTRFGLNLQFVDADTLVNDGDEVVLIPPVSGG
ncbi:thiamine S protein [Chroococcus sp. FPU101]|nr:thiamine S protein [Chroococcus sp. FPU101]